MKKMILLLLAFIPFIRVNAHVFPIDTWVRHYMVEHYNIKDDIKSIEKYARENFKEYSGLVIQYMFHSQRNLN